MGGSVGLLSISSSILILIGLTFTAAEPYFIYSLCYDTGNFTANSGYRANLNSLLSSMSSNATVINGFYKGTSGQDSDKVYGIFLCRVGVTSDMCRDCISNSAQLIIQKCPDQKEAIIWYLQCMLRYSNRSIFATMEDRPGYLWANPGVVPEGEKSDFNQVLGTLLNSLVIKAVSGPRLLFATGDATYTSPKIVSGLVQCTPDISRRDCKRCLQSAVSDVPICCDGQIAGGIQSPSCNLRYAQGIFYDPTAFPPLAPPLAPPPATSTTPPPSNATITDGKGWSSSRITIISIFVPTFIIVLILLTVIWLFLQRRTPKEKFDATFVEDVDVSRSAEFLQFDFDTIRASTNGFSDANELGEGGFGTVYKGVLSNGQEISVKRLSKDSGQGEAEFKNKAVFLAKLFHKNLVGLLGFCLEGGEKLLIYEFMPNGSLDHFIFDPMRRAQLGWEKRFKIIDGIIRGLLYLHEDSRFKIIHRDLKASNILLDQDMNPKISDFGMARLFEVEQTQQDTDRVVGTFGYMAPEYGRHGKFSVKSDVFSFGVLLLEIVSGKKNNSFTTSSENPENLLTYAWIKWREGMASELIDPTLEENYSRSEVMRCIHIGLLCVQERVAERPTMAVVVLMLNSDSFSLPLPSQPAFYPYSETDSTMPLCEYNSRTNDSHSSQVVFSINEASISELCPR